MMISKTKILAALALASSAFIAACGDSSGPSSLDANAALQSLALGLQGGGSVAIIGSPTTPDIAATFAGIAPLLTQTTVTIDGKSQPMFAIGLRESFPEGTCEESLFVDPAFPPEPGVCTPVSLSSALVFWQSHSSNEPPDRMLLVIADPGTVSFDFATTSPDGAFPAFALYVEGQQNVWASLSGTLTSSVTSMNQPCSATQPPYAKTWTCSFASFDEQGQIVLEPFDFEQTSTARMTIAIPRQTLHGIWLAITETQPVPLSPVANRFRFLAPQLGRITARFSRVR
jgi:hypothetical protein